MCFTPAISLTTAILEFAFALVILLYFRKSVLAKYVVVLLVLLGLYQFSEFGLCTTGSSALWGTFAFLSYIFLPAVTLHMTLRYLKTGKHLWLIYIPPVLAALTPLFMQPFILRATCERYFVTIWTALAQGVQGWFLGTYYFGFLTVAAILLGNALRKAKGKRRRVLMWMFAGLLLLGIPSFIVFIIFPALRTQFSSVLCEFGFLVAITYLIATAIDAK